MDQFKNKNSEIFSSDGPCKNVWGEDGASVSPGPAVVLDGPG